MTGRIVVVCGMVITLHPEQEARLGALVATGDFVSIDDAVRQLIDDHMAELAGDTEDDMAWAKPLVDEAIAAVERGEVVTLDEHNAHMARVLASLKA